MKKHENKNISFKEEQAFFTEINSLPSEFLDELKVEVKENREKINKRKAKIIFFSSIASAACILLVAYFSFFFESITYSKNYLASTKVHKNIILPDNSIVSLDSSTSMKVKFYDDRREIILSKGKAFFDVFPNKERPFIIKTDDIVTKVLGTKFEIINDKSFELNVKEGKVAVSNKKNKLLALVTKNESLTFNKNNHTKTLQQKNFKDMASWKEGKFNFNQTPLKNVLKTFSKYIDINVEIKDKSIENLKISGNFTSKEFNKLIKNLPLIYPVKIEKKDTKIVITNNI